MNTTLGNLLNDFQNLPLQDKEYFFDVVQKQLVEAKRDLLAERIFEAKEHYASGRCKSGGIKEMMEDLEGD
jgi:hypothetical protein